MSAHNFNGFEEDESLVWQNAFKEQRKLLDLSISIKQKFESDLPLEDIQKILQDLNNEYSIIDLTDGKADDKIVEMIYARESYYRSIKYEEENKRIALNVKKEKMFRQAIAVILAAATAIGGAALAIKGINHEMEKKEDARNASLNIGILASATIDDQDKTIVEQCYKILGYKNNVSAEAYDLDMMAEKVLKVCEKNPELFDLALANIYFELEFARLDHMDRLLKKISIAIQDKEELKSIYNDIGECEVFLEYLVSKNIISKNHDKYPEIVKIVEKYKAIRPTNQGYAFEVLTDGEQYVISHYLIENYKNYRDDQNYKLGMYIDDVVDKELEEGVGGRPSGS